MNIISLDTLARIRISKDLLKHLMHMPDDTELIFILDKGKEWFEVTVKHPSLKVVYPLLEIPYVDPVVRINEDDPADYLWDWNQD